MAAIFNTIILFGAIQGFIISCMFFFSRNRRQADRLLGMLIFLLALASLNLWLNMLPMANSGWFQTIDVLAPMVVIMPVGPLLYFYQCSVLDPEFKLGRKQRLHFLPVLIDLVPSLTVIGFFLGIITHIIKNHPGPVGEFIDTYNVYSDIPRWLSISVYLALSVRRLSQYRKLNRPSVAATSVKWLLQVQWAFCAFQLLWLCFLLPYVIPAYSDKLLKLVDWYPLYGPLAVLIYWLGIKGYLQRQYEVSAKAEKQATLRSDIIEKTMTALQKAMEADRIYLDPDLDLNRLSAHTGIPVKTLSAVINQHLKVSFNDLVNRYRIETFIEEYQKPGNTYLTIMGIASGCGFSSQSTFQRAFKQVTGVSPTNFKQATLQTAVKTEF